jgi:PAS domain S-box-containing protein
MNESALKILLVDDEPDIREALFLYLSEMGYSVAAAENGEAALCRFRAIRPSIVLSDIKMPGMDGIELLRKIKEESPDTEVIMISGHGDMDLAIKCLRQDAADFITKPFHEDALEIALKRAEEKISMRRQLQEALRTTRQRYQELFDEVPCYISVLDPEFKITAANRRFKEDFGWPAGSFCHTVVKQRDTPCDPCPVAKTFADGKTQQAEMVVTSRTGAQSHVLVRTAAIRNAAGQITQVMEMATDITQIRKLQEHLTSLGFLVGSISHGIKGVLTGMDAAVYLLESGYGKQDPGRVEEGLEVIKMMVERIRNLVLNILYYAKKRELNWKKTEVRKLANDAAFIVEPKIGRPDITLIRDFHEPLGSIEVDEGVFRSALINILENAVEACMEDKAKKESYEIVFSVRQKSDSIFFEISDNGMGMDRKTRENMFNLFFSSKGHSGTGLGLFIANRIVLQHGGSIRMASEPGQGATFTVCMPSILPPQIKAASSEPGSFDAPGAQSESAIFGENEVASVSARKG